jgi:hypothetical protein
VNPGAAEGTIFTVHFYLIEEEAALFGYFSTSM